MYYCRHDRIEEIPGDETAATAIEYGIIAALVSVVTAGSLGRLGGSAATMFGTIGTLLSIFGGTAN